MIKPSIIHMLVPLCIMSATTLAAQTHHGALPERSGEPMPLYTAALGPFSRSVTTTSSDAQAYFDQGIQLMYAFATQDAARAFQEAQQRDPDCAMCYWGEAWAWGAYLNAPMDSDNAPLAFDAIRTAQRVLADHATEVERALIEAMAIRYVRQHDPGTRDQLDTAYANAMRTVYERHPDDLDVATLYGEALFLLEPRRGTRDIESPAVQRIARVLEGVLIRDIEHPGACHLYIHLTEATVRPEKAQPCAEFLGDAIPGASHINHMPSHTWNRIGRWGDAVRANIQAWHSDLKAEIGEGFPIYPSHNLHMLLFAASMDGQGAVAIQAAKDYGKLVRGGQFYRALALVRFGRFDEVLELDDVPDQPIFKALWEFGKGYAHLRAGNADSARNYFARVEDAAESIPDSVTFRGHPAASLLGVVGGILRGEILLQEDRIEEAVAALERAVELEDDLRYDEPEPLNFSARHWLGAVLLEDNRNEEAERVYRMALLDHPNNGWSLFGLEEALRAQGRDAEADAVSRQLEDAWARSDTWIRGSRF
jgi:tetratricopeptide (TPR) repeat protein